MQFGQSNKFGKWSLTYDPDADEILNQGLFVDLLHSAVTSNGGTYKAVAARAGYTRWHLQNIHHRRYVPSPEALERIIQALPHLSERDARHLRDFARGASARGMRPRTARRVLDPGEAGAELDRLLHEFHLTTHGTSPADAARRRIGLYAETTRILGAVHDPLAQPLTAARLQILLCNVLNAIDDPGWALRAARIAQVVLEEHLERTEREDPRIRSLWVEAVRAEAMSFHNLNLNRAALDRYAQADHALAARPSDPQRFHIALSRISAAVATPRFRINDVLGWVRDVHLACERGTYSDLETGLMQFKARQGLALAYVQHGDLKPRTERLLWDELEGLDRVEMAGPIHQIQLYRTCAAFCAATGDATGREDFIARGQETATSAGLPNQVRKLEEELSRPAAARAGRRFGGVQFP